MTLANGTDENVGVAPRPRGELSAADLQNIERAQQRLEFAQQVLESSVLLALDAGASQRSITAATGIAGSTIQRWVNKRR